MTTDERPPPLKRAELLALIAAHEKQTETLAAARALIVRQQEEIGALSAPPSGIGTYLRPGVKENTAVIMSAGRELLVISTPDILPGDTVVLNDTMQIIGVESPVLYGAVMTITELLVDGRLIAQHGADEEMVLHRAEGLADALLETGQYIRVDPKAGLVLELLSERDETKSLLLEEVPDVTYADIGGLDTQLAEIYDSIELPFEYPELFAKYQRPTPRGVLLFGPAGCGKTLVAKAVANSLAIRTGGTAHFINVKGPELLNKWVGETERTIREIFNTARKKAVDGDVVVIFFDEMDSLFRQRGSSISSDVENTIVPQLLAEMDGVEELSNVIVIGASNRQDLIDPAVLRPGRLDIKIEVGRPDRDQAAKILAIYLTDKLPLRTDVRGGAAYMVHQTADYIYREEKETEFLEVTYVNGVQETLHFRDFTSGAMIANIVNRAKTFAIKDEINHKGVGITLEHLKQAVAQEFSENESLPNTTSPDDWAKLAGIKGERIANVRPLLKKDADDRTIESAKTTGQYL